MSNIRDVRGGIRLTVPCKGACLKSSATILIAIAALTVSSLALAGNLDKVVYFHIKAQPLEKALLQFGEQAHEQIVFASKSVMARKRTMGLTGRYTGRQALAHLLKGSKFEFVENGDTAEIVPRASVSSSKKTHYSKQTDPAVKTQTKLISRQTELDTVPPPSKSKPRTKQDVTALQQVIVTGTHIAGVVPISPVTTITLQDIKNSGLPDIASVIRTLPQFYNGGDNPNAVVGGGLNGGTSVNDISAANLRGIGAGATLTLIDGMRMSGNGPMGASDLSSIPTAAVKRIEIQAGGASAIYGADAVAGVVNVILRKHYNGLNADAYIGGTTNGGLTQRYSLLVGKTFRKGTAGIMVGYQFQSSDEILRKQRAGSSGLSAESTIQPQIKTHAVFMSMHYAPDDKITTQLEGFYNHRTSLNAFTIVNQQALEDQFAVNGALTSSIGKTQTVRIGVMYAGDSESNLSYAPTVPAYSTPYNQSSFQNRLLEIRIAEQGELMRLTGNRVIRAAVGAGFTNETLETQFSISQTSSLNAHRRKEHAYIEMRVPIFPSSDDRKGIERLTFVAAGRVEHYNDFGSISVPKLSLAYAPIINLVISASWGKSFQPPDLGALHLGSSLIRFPGFFFNNVPAGQEVLVVGGSNPALKAQTATDRTVEIAWGPKAFGIEGLKASLSYYDIDFNGVVNAPINNLSEALTNPIYAPFVIINPNAALQDQVARNVSSNTNPFGLSINPADVHALVFNTAQNISKQVIHGIDVHIGYTLGSRVGQFKFLTEASTERFDQQVVSGAALQQISGTVFNPPKFKMRLALDWSRRFLGLDIFVNHISDELNTATTPFSHVASWTTVDSQMRYIKGGLEARFSVQNVFNKSPPSIPASSTEPPGMGFDADNYSVIGRFIAFEIAERW